MHYGLRAISIDVITDYAFDNCYNFLDQDDFGYEFFATMRDLQPAAWVFQQWPFLQSIAKGLPFWLARMLSRSLEAFMQLQAVFLPVAT
jgi:hypothetical protein